MTSQFTRRWATKCFAQLRMQGCVEKNYGSCDFQNLAAMLAGHLVTNAQNSVRLKLRNYSYSFSFSQFCVGNQFAAVAGEILPYFIFGYL